MSNTLSLIIAFGSFYYNLIIYNIMKNLKKTFKIIIFIFSICLLIFGAGYLKYIIWKAEHPYAKTWTFFISSNHHK